MDFNNNISIKILLLLQVLLYCFLPKQRACRYLPELSLQHVNMSQQQPTIFVISKNKFITMIVNTVYTCILYQILLYNANGLA